MLLRSPAKLNLYLALLGRRRDGYHRLCTLFHRIGLADEITIEPLRKPRLQLDVKLGQGLAPSPAGLQGRANLIAKAYRVLAASAPLRCGFRVSLRKRIPIGAGLGGGSSNAACFLLAACRLAGLRIRRKKFLRLGARIGADVPFFLSGAQQAVGTGIGEHLQPLQPSSRMYYVLIAFPFSLSTKRIYEHAESHVFSPAALTKARADVRLLSNYLRNKDLPQISRCLQNHLLGAALSQKKPVFEAWVRLRESGGEASSMTGSGPTLFAMFRSASDAQACAQRMSDPRWTVLVTHSA